MTQHSIVSGALRPSLWFVPLISAVLLLAACGGSSDPGGSAGALSVRSADGVLTLTIPPGALTEDVDIVITPLDASDLPFDLAAGVTAFGYDLAPDGLQFAEPVTIQFRITDHGVDLAEGLPLAVVFSRDSDGALSAFADPELVADAGTVVITGQLSHFSQAWAQLSDRAVVTLAHAQLGNEEVSSPLREDDHVQVILGQSRTVVIAFFGPDVLSALGTTIRWSAIEPFTISPQASDCEAGLSCTEVTDGIVEDAFRAQATGGDLLEGAELIRLFAQYGFFGPGDQADGDSPVSAADFVPSFNISGDATCFASRAEADSDDGVEDSEPPTDPDVIDGSDTSAEDAGTAGPGDDGGVGVRTVTNRSRAEPGDPYVAEGPSGTISLPSGDCFAQDDFSEKCSEAIDLISLSWNLTCDPDRCFLSIVAGLLQTAPPIPLGLVAYATTVQAIGGAEIPAAIGASLDPRDGYECQSSTNYVAVDLGEGESCGIDASGNLVIGRWIPEDLEGPVNLTVITNDGEGAEDTVVLLLEVPFPDVIPLPGD